jgi:hypothetical protein
VVAKVVVCVFAPSPNDQFQVTPVAAELTLKTSGTPVVALDDTFRNAAVVGVELGVGELGEVGDGATSVCAVRPPAATVTSAVSTAARTAVAVPLLPVVACAGAITPRVVANVTITFANGVP